MFFAEPKAWAMIAVFISMLLVSLLIVVALAEVRSLLLILLGRRSQPVLATQPAAPRWPRVLIQLPVFNEQRMIAAQLTALSVLTYPGELLEIQVLDDSSGDSARETEQVVGRFSSRFRSLAYLNRGTRDGFKAGALNFGMTLSDAPVIVVMDIDHVPDPEFLVGLVPRLSGKIACVQACWRYRNEVSSLTEIQSAVFDSFLYFEQHVRRRAGVPAMFLGTSAVWQRRAIDEVGGWRERPFTAEDFDLAYRVNIHGWGIEHCAVPLVSCEMAESYLAYKSQQRRWASAVWRAIMSNVVGIAHRRGGMKSAAIEASFLFLQLQVIALALLCPVALASQVAGSRVGANSCIFTALSMSMVCGVSLLKMATAVRMLRGRWSWRIWSGAAYALGAGLSMMAGLLSTVFGAGGGFTRTAKRGDVASKRVSATTRELLPEALWLTMALIGGLLAVREHAYALLVFWCLSSSTYARCLLQSFREICESRTVSLISLP